MWKLDLSALTPRKKIHFLLVNAYTYFWLLVLPLHILPFIWDGELYNHDASQSLSGCIKGWLPHTGQGTGSPGGSLGAQCPHWRAPSLRGWPLRTQPRALSGSIESPGQGRWPPRARVHQAAGAQDRAGDVAAARVRDLPGGEGQRWGWARALLLHHWGRDRGPWLSWTGGPQSMCRGGRGLRGRWAGTVRADSALRALTVILNATGSPRLLFKTQFMGLPTYAAPRRRKFATPIPKLGSIC